MQIKWPGTHGQDGSQSQYELGNLEVMQRELFHGTAFSPSVVSSSRKLFFFVEKSE